MSNSIRFKLANRMFTSIGVVCLALSVASANTWTGAINGDWHAPGNWSDGVPTNGSSVTVDAGAFILLTNATAAMATFDLAAGAQLTFQGWESPLTATEMTIGGTLTHLDHLTVTETNILGGWDTLHRIYLQGSNITVAAGAMLDADSLGYPKYAGPGGSKTARDGGGHAGLGGSGYYGAGGGGAEYGDPVEPSQPGSGGGEPTKGGPGGGVIRIAAEGHLDLSGTLTANGVNGAYAHGGGGSGGSIWLDCATFGGEASGLVRTQGGSGSAQGAGGAGGRIALHYNPEAQEVLPESVPPVRFAGRGGLQGPSARDLFPAAMGTLYLPDRLFVTESLEGQRFWHVRPVIPGFTTWTPDSLAVNNCVIGFPEGFQLTVTNDLVLTNNAALHFFAAPVTDPENEAGASVSTGGNLLLTGSSWIYPYASDTNGASVLFSVGGDLVVAADSGMNADARGYRWQCGPGLSGVRFADLGSGVYLSSSSGAGHGGGGGAGWNCSGGMAVGDAADPYLPGSGSWREFSARGGGMIRLAVAGHAEISGELTAKGCQGNGSTSFASAAGGTIRLDCQTLGGAATGLICVDGGNAGNIEGGGGGGRIAVYYDLEAQAGVVAPACSFSAAGGARSAGSPQRGAENGTLYLPDTQLVQTLVETGCFQNVSLVIPDFTSWAPTSLTLNGGSFMLPVGFQLDVSGDLSLLDGSKIHIKAAPTNAPGTVGARLTVGGDLEIADGAWIHPYADWTNGAVVGIRVAGNVTIDEGGGIDADGAGFTPMGDNANGPGAGQNSSSGGGFGGHGGGTVGGVTYGRADLPLSPGSPGGWYTYSSGLRAGQGGGAIRLLVGGDIHLDGTLSANAMPREPGYGGVGASGGAIFVSGRRLTGNGLMRASGALNHSRANADGGGGRIAVWVGLPLSTVETKVASEGRSGLTKLLPYPFFKGSLEALRASDAAGDGTTGIYGIASTVFMIR